MRELLQKLYRPLSALSFFVLGASFFLTYVTIRLTAENFSVSSIGLISSVYFLGIFTGSYYLERWIFKYGNATTAAICLAGFGLSSLAMSFWINGWYWGFLRFLSGLFTAGVYISLESWLVLESSPKTRGQILSIYMIILYSSYAVGQFFLNIGPIRSPFAFAIIAITSLIAIPWVTHTPQVCSIKPPSYPTRVLDVCKQTPLGSFGALTAGIILGVIYALFPVYAKDLGLDLSEIATLMFLVVVGGLFLQWPLGKISDHLDRRFVLLLISFLAFVICLLLAFMNGIYLLILSFFLGGFTFSIYPIATTHACDLSHSSTLVKVISVMILIYGLGALIGPLLAPLVMLWSGPSGLFFFLDGILLFFMVATLLHLFFRSPAKKEEKIRFFPMSKTERCIPLHPNKPTK